MYWILFTAIIFRKPRFMKRLFLFLVLLLLSACSTTSSVSGVTVLEGNAKWALLPIENHTDTPQAALSAEAITEHLLRVHGIADIMRYPATLSRDNLFEPSERKTVEEAIKWAHEQGARYAVTGAVEEWRYKVGLDGEPAVGISLQVIDLGNGRVVWSAAGAKSGWSRDALSAVANKVIENLLGSLRIDAGAR